MQRRTRKFDIGISLTPMIDIMTTLLAVFMVTTPMMTNGIDLELPAAGRSAMTGKDHAIQISVDSVGRYYLARDAMPLDEIVQKVSAMRTENPDLTVMISGDTHADYGMVMRAMGRLKDAGIQKVGLKTKIDNK